MTSVQNRLAALTAIFLFAGAVQAQPSDPLEQSRQEIRLKAQKMKAELNGNFQDADRLLKNDPERAQDFLYKNRLLLNEDLGTLSSTEHKAYLDLVNARLAAIGNRAIAQRKANEIAVLKSYEVSAFKAKLDRDARKALALGNPSSSAVISYNQLPYKIQALTIQQLMTQQAQNQQKPGYYQPPKDKSGITKRDISTMKALDSTMRIDFKGIPMKVVLEFIEDKTKGDLNFIVDELGLKDAMVESAVLLNDPVVKEFKRGLKLRTFIRMILAERGMGYYLEDGSIVITPKLKADSKLIVKTYPVSNLVGGMQLVQLAQNELAQQNPQAPMLGPYGNLLKQNVEGLGNQIMGSVEPDHWKLTANGPGSMAFVPASASLQIRCSLEVHYLLLASGLLDNTKKTFP